MLEPLEHTPVEHVKPRPTRVIRSWFTLLMLFSPEIYNKL